MKQVKCAWCGKTVPLTFNGRRPKQHGNGRSTCVGSAQEVALHNALREAAAANMRKA